MTKLGFWVGLLVAAAGPATAQVTVEVTQPQGQFLPGEAVPITVRILNLSGQALHLGGDAEWLTFSIESRGGEVIPRVRDLPVVEAFDLPSSKMASRQFDIGPCFPISQPGRYNITATVRIKGWGREVASQPRGFDVVEGASLWQQDFGVPVPPGQTNGTPEIRRYILQEANYARGQLRLYLRVTDMTGTRPIRVVRIGGYLSFSRPEHLIDPASNLHLLYQDGPHSFSYFKFTPDGDLVARQTHEYIGTRPRLRVDVDGNITVFGGQRRVASSDVPAPKPEVTLESPKPVDAAPAAPAAPVARAAPAAGQ